MTGRALEPRAETPVPVPVRALPVPLARYAGFLPEAAALSDREPSPTARLTLAVLSLLVVAAVLWSAWAKVDQAVVAPAAVRPMGEVKIINHPSGGRVARVLVTEGQRIEAGEPLIEIDGETLGEEVRKREGERWALMARVARLDGEAADRPSLFPPELGTARPDLVAQETALREARAEAQAAERRGLDDAIRQRQHEVATLAARARQLAGSLAILKEQETAVAKLAGKGYFPQLRYLSLKRDVGESEGAVAETREEVARAEAALAEARARRDTFDGETLAAVLGELAAARAELERAGRSLDQARTELAQRVLTAPAAGIVQDLRVTTPGQSVRPSEEILKIVPTGSALLVEALVANHDIGHVALGQAARVKILAYDHIRYGALSGHVERIAADATLDEASGRLAYVVVVRTDKTHLGAGAGDQAVVPGMTAEIELSIGRRSILAWLTDRVLAVADDAFRER
jgi:adhesin transport system membrane fusion protein